MQPGFSSSEYNLLLYKLYILLYNQDSTNERLNNIVTDENLT